MQATRIAKGAVLLAVLLLSAEPAQAVKARRLRLEDLRAQAVSVVFGQVLAVTQRLDDKGMVWTDYALEVTGRSRV